MLRNDRETKIKLDFSVVGMKKVAEFPSPENKAVDVNLCWAEKSTSARLVNAIPLSQEQALLVATCVMPPGR